MTTNAKRTLMIATLTLLPVFAVLSAEQAFVDAPLPLRTASGAGGDFELNWFTVDGGGGTSSGGDFTLRGTAGQPDAGDSVGGDFALAGGYWQAFGSGCGDCPTDVDGNSDTGPFDLANLLGTWGPCKPGAPCECLDADHNGDIGPFDLAVLLGAWGPCE